MVISFVSPELHFYQNAILVEICVVLICGADRLEWSNQSLEFD